MVTRPRRCGLALGLVFLSACGGDGLGTTPDQAPATTAALSPDSVTYFPQTTWRTASPEQVGIPSSVLARVDQRARERLFSPLGISGQHWIVSSYDTTVHTGGGLHLRAIDLAKLGYLVLKQGLWNGQQVVSSAWLARSTAPLTTRASQFGGVSLDYGYLWWMAPIDPALSTAEVSNRVVIAAGNMNQFLFVAPALDLVVVNTGATNESFGVTVDFVVRELIPAILR